MTFTAKKYEVSVSFSHKLTFCNKPNDYHHWILSQNLKILKIPKNLQT
jgi:hypothetical protein